MGLFCKFPLNPIHGYDILCYKPWGKLYYHYQLTIMFPFVMSPLYQLEMVIFSTFSPWESAVPRAPQGQKLLQELRGQHLAACPGNWGLHWIHKKKITTWNVWHVWSILVWDECTEYYGIILTSTLILMQHLRFSIGCTYSFWSPMQFESTGSDYGIITIKSVHNHLFGMTIR